ncbi:sugar phosphate isomerase/epimerase family protein [Faecalicatena contorta]|jgi:sugar phosphate isomerase/epimerase|uniref:Sugar phosphate isomerase/epimerase n=1 Tax=Faecalicatena contorta TaxID=39482 RepID=A0A315ZSS0_9FIRM|nr:sugar phosphate isomerase/epimerase [Faecalicatena contorta]PWJ47784.1 sugar phosphate isomerase/epimerase [Faecalicatena contorta]SUQ15778.1 Sugar phosphate isomerase/epimerase [Faecalicatena contorta]
MTRPITLASGQFGDMSLEALCKMTSEIGYQGLELATHAHFDVARALEDPGYIPQIKSVLAAHNLNCYAISAHLTGQCVGDVWDPRLDNFAPAELSGNPEEIRKWAVQEMIRTVKAAHQMGVKVITCFTGSPIWAWWYSYPQTTPQMIEDGFQLIYDLWTPIFDMFDQYDIKFALEVHPTEIAFDYYSTQMLLKKFKYRKTLGINYDPSHLVWQGVNELAFLREFADRIYHVHVKDVKMNRNEKAGILGSHLEFGDTRRGWNFVSVGHGDVDFDGIIRELNQMGYDGPLSVEWEDSGMKRELGAAESFEYINQMNFTPSNIAFDAALKAE